MKDKNGDGHAEYAEIVTDSDPLDPQSMPSLELTLTVEQVKFQFLPAQGQTNLIQAS
jgi:hypothetical protein